MLNRLEKELSEIIDRQAEKKGNELPMSEYREVTSDYFRRIKEEKKRIIATKGRLSKTRLEVGCYYIIADFFDDILREELIKLPAGLYGTIVPKYITKNKYVAYSFKKVDEETVIFEKRVVHG